MIYMTEKNILKNLKKVTNNVKKDLNIERNKILSKIFSTEEGVMVCDGIRMIHIPKFHITESKQEWLNNHSSDLTGENDWYYRCKQIMDQHLNREVNTCWTVSREELKVIKDMLKLFKSADYPLVRFKRDLERKELVISGAEFEVDIYSNIKKNLNISYTLNSLPHEKIDNMDEYTYFSTNHMLDLIQFMIDSNEEEINLFFGLSKYDPLCVSAFNNPFEYIIMPIRKR